MKKLLSYWPGRDEVNRCIKTEAETASDAVLLSVHQPTPLSVRNAGSTSRSPATESDLLDSFLNPDLPEGTLLLAITGASGAGKSHMIRWLAANLERDPRAENLHVIRVPKSANLRSVVQLILEPLRENDRFAKAREELEKAVSSINPLDGAIHFAASLQVALREEASTFEGMIREDPGRPDVRDLKAKLDHARRLPNFFNDATLTDHFKGKVLPRIVERAIVGKDESEEELFPQFSVEDLKLPDGIGLGGAATEVQRYYQTVLNRGENDEGYKKAVEVLNSVVDKAIRNLFQLNQAMGGVTLEEIVLHIRALLMEEGKELVLLIEDFAALSGIQEVLLSVCIQEAVRDGRQVRSPMRTALAVTDGYLANRDTILTRAKREWIVESNLPSDNEIVERTEKLVGAYLNAARWGEVELIKQFDQSRRELSSGLTDWNTVYRDENETDEEADLLRAFGQVNNIPLFPFNAHALRRLIDDNLRVGGELQFNPRKIINHIIREPLLLREEFENDSFPPEAFTRRSTKASIANWIASNRLGGTVGGRLGRAIVYWGGNPDLPEQLGSIDGGVFKAFGLPKPSELGVSPTPTPEPPMTIDPSPTPEPSPTPTPDPAPLPRRPSEDDFISQWRARLDNWVEGELLPQKEANELRTAISSALFNSIDWNAECMKPVPPKRALVHLPNARGNNEAKLVFAKDTEDSDGSLRRTCLAFLRFEKRGANWGYPEADEDTALIANSLEGLVSEYLRIATARTPEDIAVLTEALTRQALVLGVAPKRIAGRRSITDAVFSSAPDIEDAAYVPGSTGERWQNLKREAKSQRQALQALLATKIGAFQGTGNLVYAIDVTRLKQSTDENLAPPEGSTPEQRTHIAGLSLNKLRARATPLAKELIEVSTKARVALGEDFDKQSVYKCIKHLAETAEEAKVWPSSSPIGKRALLNRLEQFRDAAVVDVLKKTGDLAEAISSGSLQDTIYYLGKIGTNEVEEVSSLVNQMNSFLNDLENEVRNREDQEEGLSIPDLVAETSETLSEIGSIYSKLKER